MSGSGMPDASALLGAMEGVAYVVEPTGGIEGVGARNWLAFAGQNGMAEPVAPDRLIGRNLFDIIRGDDVRDFYRDRMERLANGEAWGVTFTYRCDSPGIARHMRMSISAIRSEGRLDGFLFQSLTMSEEFRPPLDIFDAAAVVEFLSGDDRPIVTLCSVCQLVKPRADSPVEWLRPEDYYRAGGSGDVRISHGICPVCHDTGAFFG